MRIAEVRIQPYSVPLVRPWMGASAAMARRRGALVAVLTADGITGWGDCAPLPSTGDAGLQAAIVALSAAIGRLSGIELDTALTLIESIDKPEARWAFETALLDARARSEGLPLSRVLSATSVDAVEVNAALGPLDEACLNRSRAALGQGFAIGKIKVGLGAVEDEIMALREVVSVTGSRLRLRLDANQAWSEDDARRMLGALAALPIDGIEEPLTCPTPASLAALQADLPFPIAVDESIRELGLPALLAQRSIRRLVIKPARLGGLRSVLRIADRCADADVELVLTSVVDTAIGVTAAAHLAAALPRRAVHGLATSAWLAEDIAPQPAVISGLLRLPSGAGLGVDPFLHGEPA